MVDVAKIAGVSTSTVSHVVNRTRPVAPGTSQRVLEAIAHTGYMPDDVARSMRTTGSRTVGLAVSAISNVYFGDVVRVIERTLARAGYTLLLADTHDDTATELRAVASLLAQRVDAMILAPSAEPDDAIRYAQQREVPVVLIDRFSPIDVDQVAATNEEPTASLVDHLAGRGHQRIAMISGKEGLSTSLERIAGYRNGLRRNGLRFLDEYLVSGDSTDEGARRAFRFLMDQDQPPSALVVGNNNMTIGVMRAAREMAIRIPEDVAMTGFDDFEWGDLLHPGPTVVAQPTTAMGRQAVEMALSRLAEPAMPARRVLLGTTFVHRESCGCQIEARPAPAARSPLQPP